MSIASFPMQDRRGAGRAAAPPRPSRAATHALIIHKAEIVRLGVSTMLASGSACEVSSAGSVYEAFRLASDVHPQLVLFDFTPTEGPEVGRLLAALWPRPRLIALVTRGREVAPADCIAVGVDAAMLLDNINRAVGNAGELSGVYSNGQTQVLGQIALANFLNSAGLLRAGQNNFAATSASGAANVGTAGTGGRGTVTTGALEMSNVDLATQFTGMITAERGFQANSRVITTSDEMLQELVNLKR